MTTAAAAPTIPPCPAPSSWRRLLAVFEWGMLLLVIVAGLVAWGIGIVVRRYDYDEVQHPFGLARGARPAALHDLVRGPSPLLRPAVADRSVVDRSLRSPAGMRLFSALGNLAFLGGLVALGWCLGPARGSRWIWLGVLSVAFQPTILDFLIEFRIDGWGYAVAAWSLVGFLCRPGRRLSFAAFGVFSGIATIMFCPKLAILPPLVVALKILRLRRGVRAALGLGTAYLVGVGIAGAWFAPLLDQHRHRDRPHVPAPVPLSHPEQCALRLPSRAPADHRRDAALARADRSGVRCMGVGRLEGADLPRGLSRGDRTLAVDPGTPGGLSLQAVLRTLVPLWLGLHDLSGPRTERLGWLPGALGYLLVCGTTIFCAVRTRAPLGALRRGPESLRHPPRDEPARRSRGPCRAPSSEHPIDRRDVFFLWFNTSDPNGFDSERILESLGPYRREVSLEQNREAARSHRPAFVVLDAGPYAVAYPAHQWQALRNFLPRHGYRVVRLGACGWRCGRSSHPPRAVRALRGRPGPLAPVRPAPR